MRELSFYEEKYIAFAKDAKQLFLSNKTKGKSLFEAASTAGTTQALSKLKTAQECATLFVDDRILSKPHFSDNIGKSIDNPSIELVTQGIIGNHFRYPIYSVLEDKGNLPIGLVRKIFRQYYNVWTQKKRCEDFFVFIPGIESEIPEFSIDNIVLRQIDEHEEDSIFNKLGKLLNNNIYLFSSTRYVITLKKDVIIDEETFNTESQRLITALRLISSKELRTSAIARVATLRGPMMGGISYGEQHLPNTLKSLFNCDYKFPKNKKAELKRIYNLLKLKEDLFSFSVQDNFSTFYNFSGSILYPETVTAKNSSY